MRDVEYLEHNGAFNIKALTPRARQLMGSYMGGPWEMAKDVFWMRVPRDKITATLARLESMGLQTECDIIDVNSLTEF